MSSKDDFYINFSGITHDHALSNPQYEQNEQTASKKSSPETKTASTHSDCSTIAILRRHPMYDCLILVKKFRNCLNGYSLEFPAGRLTTEDQFLSSQTDENDDEHSSFEERQQQNSGTKSCGRRKLISRFLDGDDPVYQSCCVNANCFENGSSTCGGVLRFPLEVQNDDRGDTCELVQVPINGLLDRLKSYTRSGLAVDSRVYAFAMGLKTAERTLTTNSMKELQETPI